MNQMIKYRQNALNHYPFCKVSFCKELAKKGEYCFIHNQIRCQAGQSFSSQKNNSLTTNDLLGLQSIRQLTFEKMLEITKNNVRRSEKNE